MKISVQERALARNILNAHQLHLEARIPYATAISMWSGKAKMIDLKTLDRVCKALRCRPNRVIISQE